MQPPTPAPQSQDPQLPAVADVLRNAQHVATEAALASAGIAARARAKIYLAELAAMNETQRQQEIEDARTQEQRDTDEHEATTGREIDERDWCSDTADRY